MLPTIRLASIDDAPAIAAIYAPFCDSSVVSFEYAAPAAAEMADRIRMVLAQYPWIVLEDGGRLLGYAYASRHAERAAYGWAVNTSVYVAPSAHRRGVGRALYVTLLALLRSQGYFRAYAGITLPNAASTGLHEAMGFRPAGVYERAGFKFGSWHDVAWYQADLLADQPSPMPPVPIATTIHSPAWEDAIANGLRHYRPDA